MIDENCEAFCKVGDFVLSKDKTRLLLSDLTGAQTILPETVQRVEDMALLGNYFYNRKSTKQRDIYWFAF